MDNEIYVKAYDAPKINKKEIIRYMGAKEINPEIDDIIEECINEVKNQLSYKVCYREFDILINENIVDFGSFKAYSKDLAKNLKKCKKAIVFAATTGIGIDRLIIKYSKLSPVKALVLQAIGAERIESLCDMFERDTGYHTVPRFSAGYGDLSLETQRDIFKVLSPEKRIGLTLNESLVMSPLKSVTAIMGISDFPCDKKNKCNLCEKKECNFRREI